MKNLTLELNNLVEVDATFQDLSQNPIVRTAFLYNNEPQWVLDQAVKKGETFTIRNTNLSPGPVNVIAEDAHGNRTALGTIARGSNLSHTAAKTETLKLYVQRAEAIIGLYVGILY